MKSKLLKTSVGLAAVTLLAFNASATLVDLGPGSFVPLAPEITFSEVALGTVDPSITVAAGSLGNVTVSSAGSFVGQTVFQINPGVYSISGSPTGPLTLNTGPNASTVFTADDGSNPGSPVLSGSPTFNGPISILFSTPVAAVGLQGGYFDAIGSTEIEAFDVNGNSLGDIFNTALGLQFYGLADSSGGNVIAGISFYINGTEPAGFAIDDLTFGAADQVIIPGVPDNALTIVLLLGSVLGLVLVQKRFSIAAR